MLFLLAQVGESRSFLLFYCATGMLPSIWAAEWSMPCIGEVEGMRCRTALRLVPQASISPVQSCSQIPRWATSLSAGPDLHKHGCCWGSRRITLFQLRISLRKVQAP